MCAWWRYKRISGVNSDGHGYQKRIAARSLQIIGFNNAVDVFQG